MNRTTRTKSARRSAAPEPRTSSEAVRRATGRNRESWFKLLDKWGAETREHRDIAAWLSDEHSVDGWWAQMLTVEYEQARGLREPGGSRDGNFSVGAAKTVAVPVGRLYKAFADARLRKRWPSAMTIRLVPVPASWLRALARQIRLPTSVTLS